MLRDDPFSVIFLNASPPNAALRFVSFGVDPFKSGYETELLLKDLVSREGQKSENQNRFMRIAAEYSVSSFMIIDRRDLV